MDALNHAYLARLVTKAQAGDSNAFAELYAATYQRQYVYAMSILHDTHLAQDALQDAYVRVLKTIGQLQNPMVFVAWLNRITFNACYDLRRKYSRLADMPNEAIEDVDHSYGVGVSPEDELVAVDSNEYLLKQVLSLPAVESQAIIMRYYQDMPIDDIARTLSVSRSTVKRYIKAGVEHLRRLMS